MNPLNEPLKEATDLARFPRVKPIAWLRQLKVTIMIELVEFEEFQADFIHLLEITRLHLMSCPTVLFAELRKYLLHSIN